MQTRTINALRRILNDQMGFVLDTDMATLLADDRTRDRDVLIRCHSGRQVLPLKHALDAIDEATKDNDLRDVAFTARTYRLLAIEVNQHLDPETQVRVPEHY